MKFVAGAGTEADQIYRAARARRAWREAQRERPKEHAVLITLSPQGMQAYLHTVLRDDIDYQGVMRFGHVREIAGCPVLIREEQIDPFEIWVQP